MSNFLDSFVSSLPVGVQPYVKTYVAAILAALTVVIAAIPEAPRWITIVIAVLSAPTVYAMPNKDPNAVKQDESVQPPAAPTATSSVDASDPANL